MKGESRGTCSKELCQRFVQERSSRLQEDKASSRVYESQPRILLQGNSVVAIVRVHCLMESGLNKFDDLSGASEPAKFDRKTLIDSTPCTEQNVMSTPNTLHSQGYEEFWKEIARLSATMTELSRMNPTKADPEVRHTQRSRVPAFTTPT